MLGARLEQNGTRFQGWLGVQRDALPAATAADPVLQSHRFYLGEVADQSRYLMSEPEESARRRAGFERTQRVEQAAGYRGLRAYGALRARRAAGPAAHDGVPEPHERPRPAGAASCLHGGDRRMGDGARTAGGRPQRRRGHGRHPGPPPRPHGPPACGSRPGAHRPRDPRRDDGHDGGVVPGVPSVPQQEGGAPGRRGPAMVGPVCADRQRTALRLRRGTRSPARPVLPLQRPAGSPGAASLRRALDRRRPACGQGRRRLLHTPAGGR